MPTQVRLSSGHLIIPIVLCLAAAGFNAFFALPLLPTWYAGLIKPAFLPVDTFPFVMVVLFVYLLLGCSVIFIWHASRMAKHDQLLCLGLIIFTIILMGLWGYIFFGLKSPFLGVMISVFVISMLIATMLQSVKVSFGAMLLLTVVVILTFLIAYTNYLIVQYNPSLPIFGI
ncbi:MAG: tryptophan-rich sensory protein [Methanoregula sp.]|jgi:tryptophan-rich sensory protein|uniref:tryptophan-rich sensory protein n=1 Tax=Methanoregula sp. TaxID=2052170 RepID=UPI003D13F7DF